MVGGTLVTQSLKIPYSQGCQRIGIHHSTLWCTDPGKSQGGKLSHPKPFQDSMIFTRIQILALLQYLNWKYLMSLLIELIALFQSPFFFS